MRAKLHHIIKVAQSATKKAKQHEVQKLVRRLKQADASQDLEQELNCLKGLDVRALAIRALFSKLVKSKLLPKSSQLKDMHRFPLLPLAKDANIDPALMNSLVSFQDMMHERVAHQVQSSKVVAGALSICVQSLMALIAPPKEHDQSLSKSNLTKSPTTADKPERSRFERIEENISKSSPDVADNGYESDDGMGNERPAFGDGDMDAMVAPGSDTDDSDNDHDTRDETMNESDNDSSSAFLPSLNTGFIPAADGDDWSDAEADFADTGNKGPAKSQRKNRRGQRERRAYVFILH